MPSKKLNSMPDYQARMPRVPHQPEQSRTWTVVPGAITPMYYQMCHPGSKLNFQNAIYARYQPIKLPFLGSCDIHVDSFFVPLSVIYTPALSLFYQTDDLVSSAINTSILQVDKFPVVDLDGSIRKYITDHIGTGVGQYADLNSAAQRQYSTRVGYAWTDAQVLLDPNVFDCLPKSSCRLLNCLSYNPREWFGNGSGSSQYNPISTPWFACAYQAIYQLYPMYRNSDREGKDYTYNLDIHYTLASAILNGSLMDRLFSMRYVDEYKDYFNCVKVSPIGSSVSMLGGQSSWDILSKLNSYISTLSFGRSNSYGINVVSFDKDGVSIGQNKTSQVDPNQRFNYGVNAANIRQLFMVDKLLRVTGRADKNYEAQFLAHYGIEVPHDDYHNITHISHDVFTLNTNEITSLANTFNGQTGSALGEFGGNGQVRGVGRGRKFTAPCHGVFMVNVTVIPRYRYHAGIDKLHDLSSMEKFWQPEYDLIGMQPVYEYECQIGNTTLATGRVGWQFGYEQFKRKYDIVSDAFMLPRSYNSVNQYSAWVLAKEPYGHFKKDGTYIAGAFNGLDWSSFKVSPTSLNGVTEVLYDTGWSSDLTFATRYLLWQTDPIIMDFTCHMGETNFMSEYSEPELG